MFYQRSLLFRVLDSFFRYKIVFIVSTVAVILMVGGYLFTKPKTYVATYTIIEDSGALSNPLGDGSQGPSWDAVDQDVNHLQTLIQTQDFIATSLKNADGTPMQLKYPIDLNNLDQMQDLRKSINVSDNSSDSFSVSMEYKDPGDEQKILDGIITNYITETAQQKSASYSAEVAFIQQQVDAYRQKLIDAESALTNFKQQNANNLPEQQGAIQQQVITYQSQMSNEYTSSIIKTEIFSLKFWTAIE